MAMNNAKIFINVKVPLINFQSVRWRTKPRWVPIAKTKRFRVSHQTRPPHEEYIELTKLTKIYQTQMKSIKKFLTDRYIQAEESDETLKDLEEQEEFEWQTALKINEEWNAKQKVEREQRDKEELDIKKMEALLKVVELGKKNRETLEEIDELIRLEKEKAAEFITADNIDEAIETALETYTDFNFCIDLKGNIYYGTRGTVPADQDERLLESNDKRAEVSSST